MKTKIDRKEELRALLKQFDKFAGSDRPKEPQPIHICRDTHYRDTVKNKERQKKVRLSFKRKMERLDEKITKIQKKKHKHRNDKRFNQLKYTRKIERLALKINGI